MYLTISVSVCIILLFCMVCMRLVGYYYDSYAQILVYAQPSQLNWTYLLKSVINSLLICGSTILIKP